MTLVLGSPELPSHLFWRNGFLYARAVRRASPGPRWLSLAPGDERLPWATLVHGLETDSLGLRARFVAALREAAAHASDLDDLAATFGRPLAAAFRRIFGGRGEDGHTPGFRAWALGLASESPSLVGRVAALGLLGWDDPRASAALHLAALPVDLMAEHEGRLDLARRLREPVNPPDDPDDSDSEADVDDAPPARSFGSAAELEAHLDSLGFTPTAAAATALTTAAPSPGPLGAGDLVGSLLRRGRALAFDAETGHVPVGHDEVLYWLAGIAPSLGDVVFDQVVPVDIEDDSPEGPYSLIAHSDGVRRRTLAVFLGDFYDVPSCVGLVNTLLFLRRSGDRVVSLDTGDQGACLVAGPRRALRTLRAEGLLVWGEEG